VTVILRHEDAIVPSGSTVLQEGDRVTLIGTPERIHELGRRYADARTDVPL
jgi:Trk K+ transport system NAD-binding subunit